MGATYTYLIADLRGGDILDELPLSGVTFDKKLNDTGSLRAQLYVGDPEIRVREPRLLTEPGRTAVYVDRDGELLWGGIVWTSRYSGASNVLELGAADLLSYFEHRLVLDPEDPTAGVPLAGDQLAVARSLVTGAQSHPGGDLGIVFTGAESSGVTRTVTYSPGDLKPVADALRDLANADDGFDFTVDVRYGESGEPQRFLRFGFPRLGQPGAPYVWEYGANLVDYVWPSDAASMATRVLAPGGAPVVTDPTALTAGWPLLDAQVSPSDTTDAAMLDAQVKGELAARRRPVVLPELTVRADLDPVVGSYSVGDDARIVIDDPFFAGEQLDVTVRILGLEVTPGDDAGQEQVTLTVAPFLEQS
ncbi:hypothetical protein [Actinophytocola oryzae]|uniref:ReqiPepy6 Gp37-like protein n=1 Tax=Actinophytocola oryzae TaxID=502181 RepID=A0A4R7VF50_9PSEU|nr:hypothetical protein [Actinophytocola oryzae]TDV47853.1 hypothetical protein CLV71_10988 [Actinophytocola oryzae]